MEVQKLVKVNFSDMTPNHKKAKMGDLQFTLKFLPQSNKLTSVMQIDDGYDDYEEVIWKIL